MFNSHTVEDFWWHDHYLMSATIKGDDCVWKIRSLEVLRTHPQLTTCVDMMTEAVTIVFKNYRYIKYEEEAMSEKAKAMLSGRHRPQEDFAYETALVFNWAGQCGTNVAGFEFIDDFDCPAVEVEYDEMDISWDANKCPSYFQQEKAGIERMVRELSVYNPKEHQQAAMAQLEHLAPIFMDRLIMPPANDSWENAAVVLVGKDDEAIRDVIPGMLEWITRTNRPGVKTIFERLKTIPRYSLLNHLMVAIDKALDTYGGRREDSLAALYDLIDETGLHAGVKMRLAVYPRERIVKLVDALALESEYISSTIGIIEQEMDGAERRAKEKRRLKWLHELTMMVRIDAEQ